MTRNPSQNRPQTADTQVRNLPVLEALLLGAEVAQKETIGYVLNPT